MLQDGKKRSQPLPLSHTFVSLIRQREKDSFGSYYIIFRNHRFHSKKDSFFVGCIDEIMKRRQFFQGISTNEGIFLIAQDVHVGTNTILSRNHSCFFQFVPANYHWKSQLLLGTFITKVHQWSHGKIVLS